MNTPLILQGAFIDQILFAMEDQDVVRTFDPISGQIVLLKDDIDTDNLPIIPLPTWTSADGYHLMRDFTQQLHHPVLQADLMAVLESGQGIFKKFKQTLKVQEKFYRQWLRYKRRRMEERIATWAQEWPEYFRWERQAQPSSLTDELLASDFSIRHGREDEVEILQQGFRRASQERVREIFNQLDDQTLTDFLCQGRTWQPTDHFWVAENPQPEWTGFLWGRTWPGPTNTESIFEILAWYVVPEYRGLGLGALLLKSAQALGQRLWLAGVPAQAEIEANLRQKGFLPCGLTYFS